MENERLSRIIQRFREMRLPMMAEQLINLIESNELPTLSPIDLIDRISEQNSTLGRTIPSNAFVGMHASPNPMHGS